MGTRQTTIRFPERTDQQLDALIPLFGDRTKAIVVAVDRLFHSEIGGDKMYELDIYTWPAMMGVNPQLRKSRHETPDAAIAHLDAQTEPYAYAVLLRQTEPGSWTPCDWNGEYVETSWPYRRGANGDHPSVVALREDWDNLIELVRKAKERRPGTGTIDIAREILDERHPEICGYSERLANAEYDSTHHHSS